MRDLAVFDLVPLRDQSFAPGNVWTVAAMSRSALKSCAEAKQPCGAKVAPVIAQDLSVRTPDCRGSGRF